MAKGISVACFLILMVSCTTAPEAPWEPIFNGRDLAGWTVKIRGYPVGENYGETFRVADSVLQVSYSGYDRFGNAFGHLFYEKELRFFKLRFEYRFLGDTLPGTPEWAFRNSGLMLYSQSPGSMNLEQEFPVSLEAQLLGGYPDTARRRPTGNLCTPGLRVKREGRWLRDHCTVGAGPTLHGEDWVAFEVGALPDGRFYHLVEGDTAIVYSDPVVGGDHLPYNFPRGDASPVEKGYIAFQSEGHPVEFRKIELLRLDR